MINERFKNIEFLRILGCVSIVLFHLFNSYRLGGIFKDIQLYQNLSFATNYGGRAVELFFIIAGVMFALRLNLLMSFWDFLIKKLIRLYPVILFSIIAFSLFSLIGGFKLDAIELILSLFLLDGTLLKLTHSEIGPLWCIPVLLWTLLFFFYLLKNYKKETINFIIVLIVIFSYAFILHTRGGRIYQTIETYGYVFNIATLRALAGVGLGYLIGDIYKSNKESIDKTNSLSLTIFCTFGEVLALVFIVYNLMFSKPSFNQEIIFVIAFAFILIFFLIKKGLVSKLFEINFWHYFSKYSYSIFVTHVVVLDTLREIFWLSPLAKYVYSYPALNMFCSIALILVMGAFTYHFVEKPVMVYFDKNCK